MSKVYLSVDLGGTSLRMGLLNATGEILAVETISSERVRLPADIVKEILQLVHHLESKAKAPIGGLALGIPGLVDSVRGIVHRSPHFPLWKDVALRDALQASLNYPVVMDNDANQAALGEAWKGAGQQWKDFVLMTLGTGIGGGIILDGKIFHGPSGFAGEIGHIVIERGGREGVLGSEGTLEALASQSGLKTLLKKYPIASVSLNPDDSDLPKKLHDLARSGNPEAIAIWKNFGEALGCGVASVAHTLGVFKFVIGGGLIGAWFFFAKACFQESRRRSYDFTANQIDIIPAELGDHAGLIGGVHRFSSEP